MQRFTGCYGKILRSPERALLYWLNLAQMGPGGWFLVEEAFGIQGLVSRMEICLHGLAQTGN